MPNLGYQLTLTSEGASSGPYYVVTYTTGSTYVPVIAGSPAYLPNVGDTATVVIDSGSYSYLAFKLNNGTSGCDLCDNDVILVVTGSLVCCTPTINSVTATGSNVSVAFTLPSGACSDCVATTIQSSYDGVTWFGNNTGGCTSPRTISTSGLSLGCTGSTVYYRMYQICSGSVTSSFSNTGSIFLSGSGIVCCTPTITSIAPSGSATSSLFINYSAGAGSCCLTCSFVTLTTSSDGTNWGGAVTASCTGSQFIVTAPSCNTSSYYRLQQTCSGSVTSSFSPTASFSYACSGSCVTVEYNSFSEEYLDCGIFNLLRGYTASYFENCTASNAPQDITVWITSSYGSPVQFLYYDLVIESGSHAGYTTVYTREWTGTCLNRESINYTITGYNIVPNYPECDCPPPPPPPPCVTSATFDVDVAGNVSYIDCCGNSITNFYGIGPQVINDCIENGTVTATGATISSLTYGVTSCECPPPPSQFFYYSVRKFDCQNSCAQVSPDLVARSSVAKSTTNGFYYNPLGDGFVYQIQTEITPAPLSWDIDITNAPSNAVCSTACIF